MKFLKQLLSEHGEVSCMRFMSLASLVIGAGIAYYSLYLTCDIAAATPAISVFVGAAFGGKVWQKFAENKDVKGVVKNVEES